MKPNEAPEKLYFGEADKGILDIYSNRESNDEIKYTRTDAFIEKAREWLRNYLCDYFDDTRETYDMCIDEFIKAMKV